MSNSVPNIRYTILTTTDYILTIRWKTTLNHEIFTLGTKESLSNSWTSKRFIFNETDAIVSWMDKDFVLILRMDNDLIYFITFKFFLSYLEVIVCINFSMFERNVPNTNLTSWISYKESSISIKCHAVRMNVIKDSSWLDYLCTLTCGD